jgi:hypothetical protein
MMGHSRAMLSTARPSPLRLAGFLCTAAGAVLMAIGALTTWASVVLKAAAGQPANTSLNSTYTGVDTWEGIVVLVAAVVVLLAVMATRLAAEPATGRALALVAVVACLVVIVVAAATFVRADQRYTDPAARGIATALSRQTGLPVAAIEQQLETQRADLVEIDPGIGIALAFAGGVLGLVGALLVAAWARRRRLVDGVEEPIDGVEEPIDGIDREDEYPDGERGTDADEGPPDGQAGSDGDERTPVELAGEVGDEPTPGPGRDPLFPAVGDDPGPHEIGS